MMNLSLVIVPVVLLLSATSGVLSHETLTDEEITTYTNQLQQQEQLQQSLTQISSSRLPNYKQMNFNTPKRIIPLNHAHGICFGPDGKFVIVSWSSRLIYLFSSCGDIIRKIPAPKGSHVFSDCVYTSNTILVTDYGAKKIYQFSIQGSFQRVFATGHPFLRLTEKNGKLYVTNHNNLILIFEISSRRIIQSFRTSSGIARAIAFDSANNMHVSIFGNSEEVYTIKGKQVRFNRYCGELDRADGIAIDTADNVIITDHVKHGEVLVYNSKGFLIKRLSGFKGRVVDVAVDKLGNLWVVAHDDHKVYKF